VPVVIYSRRNLGYMMLYIAFSLALFCSIYFLNFNHTPWHISMDAALLFKLKFLFSVTAIVCEVIVLFSIISNYDRTERRLDEDNELLQQQFQSIFENSFDALFLVDWKKTQDHQSQQARKRAV